MNIDYRLDEERQGGCIFPMKDPTTGKRNRLCGKPTLFNSNNVPMGFCAEHRSIVERSTKFAAQEFRRKSPEHRKNEKKHFRLGKYIDPIGEGVREKNAAIAAIAKS